MLHQDRIPAGTLQLHPGHEERAEETAAHARLRTALRNGFRPGFPPSLAVFCGELTPYRTHFHQRIAREIEDLRLVTVQFHDSATSAWKGDAPEELNHHALAEGEVARSREGLVGRTPVFRGHSGLASQWRRSASAIRFLEDLRPAAVLCNGYSELVQLRVIDWCNTRGVPVIFWADSNIRGDRSTGLARKIKDTLVPRIMARCDAVLCCGTNGRAYYRRYGVPDSKIFYSPCEPDYDQIAKVTPEKLAEVAARFNLKADRKRFVVSSRLVAIKQIHLSLGQFIDLADRIPEWDMLIVGDGPERARLEAMVPAHLKHRVTFTGFLGQQVDVSACYRLSHAMVHMACYDAWALVINEAAAAGLPIIVSDVTGAAIDLVKNGRNGQIVGYTDVAALRQAMLWITEPGVAERCGRESLEVLAEWRQVADPIAGLRAALDSVRAPASYPFPVPTYSRRPSEHAVPALHAAIS